MSNEEIVRFEPDDKPSHILSAGLGLQVTVMIITGIMLTPLDCWPGGRSSFRSD